ncbi:uncharacterized protein LOC109708416 [Ananas comosus]|uniref:Uncharacterized protein LOC109708416 n=1 Tax=Ananas comosus TaxID=4615 RepID=A0A6P5EQE3_ANACO|nr:uncharacterized protein LOC109708416 [Ananas comosus]
MSAPAPPVKKDGSCGDLEANCGSSGTATASTPRRRMVWKPLFASFFAALLLWAADTSVVRGGATRPPPLQLGYYLGSYSAHTSSPTTPPPIFKNSSSIVLVRKKPIFWMSVPIAPNFTTTLLSRWMAPAGDSRTADISIPALDGRASPVELSAAEIHEFSFTALDAAGRPRSLGGDYFEVDLSGPSWKSRPPLLDRGDGSYSLRLQVAPDFAGAFNLTVTLLFRSFEGLKMSPARLKYGRQLRKIPVIISRPDLSTGDGDGSASSPPALRTCRSSDFGQDFWWSGRWTRHGGKEREGECAVDDEGRYRCLAPDHPCERPWCTGPLGALESDGWVYSAHCSFKIFAGEQAWDCLAKKWIFFWGDSNHVDTVRNLLHFVLGRADVKQVPRRFDYNFTNPSNASQSVRITSIFNGHWNESMNYLGLQSLENKGFRRLLWRFFSAEERVPDVMILNSGLHDGVYWRSVRAFAGGAERAAEFWAEVVRRVRERGRAAPRVFYRTTIAAGGYAREMAFNPSKMEAFDGVLLEKLKEKGLLSGVIDDFDMTFPWHYDNRCSDGVHYGRAPAKKLWRDGQIGHHYFVDLMLGHVLLNAICGD